MPERALAMACDECGAPGRKHAVECRKNKGTRLRIAKTGNSKTVNGKDIKKGNHIHDYTFVRVIARYIDPETGQVVEMHLKKCLEAGCPEPEITEEHRSSK